MVTDKERGLVITFVSNYINHHQLPFCEAISSLGDDVTFFFIQTMPMEEKRKSMGWAVDERAYPYLILYYEDEKRAKDLILGSDVVLFGWTEGKLSELRKERLSSGKLSFCVSERIYREGQWKCISPRGLINKYHEHFVFRNKPVYLLCTGAYVASDFSLIKSYPGKMLKWGYFPDAARGLGDSEEKKSDGNTVNLCWAGRLIELKHPEFAVKAAAALKSAGYGFSLDLIGEGPLKTELQEMVRKEKLEDVVTIHGGKKPAEVLSYMREADVFLFTSNYLEGWGAVVNEAMQCGCAVLASAEAGAVPFLIKDGENGLIYDRGDYDHFERRLRELLDDRSRIELLGKRAKDTIENTWNAKRAAKELVRFCKEQLEGKKPVPAKEGPMSVADIIEPPGFARTFQEKNRLE